MLKPPFDVQYNPLSNAFSYVNGLGRRKRIGGPVVPPAGPPDDQDYPLTMPPATIPGETVTIGKGPDRITLRLACSPGTQDGNYNVIAVLIGDKAIAGPLIVSGTTGMMAGQIFNILGDFPPLPLDIKLVTANEQQGIQNIWFNAGSYNLVPLQYTGPSLNGREPDTRILVNQTAIWDNKGYAIKLSTKEVAEEPPVPPAVPLLIDGAKINGKATPAATLPDLEAATANGDVLLLPAGTFVGTTGMKAITLSGAGLDKTTINAANLDEYHGKAILVPLASGAKITDLTLSNATGPDMNTAGVRQDGPNIDYTLERVRITGCQDGILAFGAVITLTDCITENNGAGDGYSHEMYFNGGIVTLNNHTSTCGPGAAHAVKSRAGTTNINGGVFTGTPGTGPASGSIIDVPDGGVLKIKGATLKGSPGAPNRVILSYALESQNNGVADVVLTNVALIFAPGEQWYLSGVAGAHLVIGAGCTYPKGCLPPQPQNWGSVSGAFTPA